MEWIKKLFGLSTPKNNKVEILIDNVNIETADTHHVGPIDEQHYTDSVETIKQLKRDGKHDEAIGILLKAVESTESETAFSGEGWGVAPWYYEQLAIIYRKEKLYQKEVEILERYSRQSKAPGVGQEKLDKRLSKAKILLAKHEN
jgi:hypothetical protein